MAATAAAAVAALAIAGSLYTMARRLRIHTHMFGPNVVALSSTRKSESVLWHRSQLQSTAHTNTIRTDNKFVSLSSNRINLFFTLVWQNGNMYYPLAEEIGDDRRHRNVCVRARARATAPFTFFGL